jgi:uncharacterized protein (DUF362 family)
MSHLVRPAEPVRPLQLRPQVRIARCTEYDVERIQQIIGESLDAFGLRPFGRTLIKPNVVAAGQSFPHAFTRPEFTEGVMRALRERARDDLREIAIGERCGITMPTRFAFAEGGYHALIERNPWAKLYHFEETSQVPVSLTHPERLRDVIYTPEPVASADFFVNCPKFKAHPWTTVTFSLKNYIGIQDDRHRLIDHDHKLDEKVADLQYIVQPQFIAIDGIIAGEGRMLTPIPFDLGLIMTGTNQVAFDAVCCHIIGVDPMSVPHIRLAHERGFGPVDLSEIDLGGDVTLHEATKLATGFRVGLVRVEEYFKGTNIQAYAGPPPSDTVDYCWGGCPGAMEEAVEIMRLFDDKTDAKMPKTHVVFGAYDGVIDAQPGERVIFIGDCATYKGTIAGKPVELKSLYRDRSTQDPKTATSDDIFVKMWKTTKRFWGAEGDVVRLEGCPVSVAEQVLTLVKVGGLKNPYLDMGQAKPFMNAYFSWRLHELARRLLGVAYQVPTAAEETKHGWAKPVLSATFSATTTAEAE